jgi:quinoprotein glucose dehydrogenase
MAIKRFRAPKGFKVELIAAEPLLANPVAFCIDEKGRIYVAETFRLADCALDIRERRAWPSAEFRESLSPERRAGLEDELLEADLACRTVEDRVAMLKKYFGSKIGQLTRETERVRLLEDQDGDGKMDHATEFAGGFNTIADGLGAGVLARQGAVWYANIPNLWRLRDTNGDGVADVRQSLHSGFGVHVGFIGHDLHGLRMGPDGKLYFSVGDRGANIKTKEGKTIFNPDTGAVYRCNPDGSDLEIFAYGLRNPQELAFDQYGNLWTGDNNSDSGDKARWVYVVEGGDSGWRIGYQFMQAPYSRGPFNAEKLWYPHWKGQAAYIVPPITNLADGPSGVTYNPGTGMPEQYREHFFLCDFHGGKGSGIHSFAVKPKGAYFELVDRTDFLWEVLPTDVDFGVDGGIYYSDWVQGWGKTGKGRIYRVYEPGAVEKPIVRETKKLLAEGMSGRAQDALADLLAHPDMRVRQEAQFALADQNAVQIFAAVAANPAGPRLARLHAIWGLGQISSKSKVQSSKSMAALEPLLPLLGDAEGEVRAQAAKVLGDGSVIKAYDGLLKLLHDQSARVRFFAAISLGKLGRKEAAQPLFEMVRADADEDPYLRHAAVMGLARLGEIQPLTAAARDISPAVRLAAVVALRRLERPEVANFLKDADEGVVREAARAINDQPINAALPQLAALIRTPSQDEPTMLRVVNANFRLGTAPAAAALAELCARSDALERGRVEALDALGDWAKPSGRDRIVGLWRPLPIRDPQVGVDALRPVLAGMLRSAPDSVRVAAARLAGQLRMTDTAPVLLELMTDAHLATPVRLQALRSLGTLKLPRLEEAVKLALNDPDEALRKEASKLQAQFQPTDAIERLVLVLEKATMGEKQAAFEALGKMPGPAADLLLAQWLDKLLEGKVAPELKVDLLDAAAARSAPEIKERLQHYEDALPKNDPLAPFRIALYGGDAKEGRKIFFERPEAACVRCHKISGEGGEVGPDLSQLAARQTREYILESVLLPNKQIAQGYETVVATLKNGTAYAGIVKSENDTELVLNSPEDGLLTLKKKDIQSRERGLSAMPDGLQNALSKKDLQDLVEFLANLK